MKFVSVPTDDFLVGIDEPLPGITLQMTISPNPVRDHCRIGFRVEKTDWLNMKLYDLSGRGIIQIAERKFTKGNHQVGLDIGHLRPGSYVIMIDGTHYKGSMQLIKL